MSKPLNITVMRFLLGATAALLLGACASTSSYHRGSGGGDYYYGDSGYYQRGAGDAWARHCARDARYGYYDRYSYPDCHALGWWAVGPYPWSLRDGWAYPYGYDYYGGVYDPYYAWNGGWSGSLWLGFGGYGAWGYPGFHNPWFGPWWPYSVVYPVHHRPFRDRQRLRREQALQAAWRRSAPQPRIGAHSGAARSAGVVQRQSAPARQRAALRTRHSATTPRAPLPRAARPSPATEQGQTMPRGRPAARGIPVHWPVNTRQPHRSSRHVQPLRVPTSPGPGPGALPETFDPRSNADAVISREQQRPLPIPSRNLPRRDRPLPALRRAPAARPVLHHAPPAPAPVQRTPVNRSSTAPAPRSSPPARSRPATTTKGMPRGKPRARH